MLQTINGFDLLLVIIITILGFKVYNLKQETKSMTTGLTNIMNELIGPLQKLIHHNGCNCTTCYIRVQPPKDLYGCVCNYCTDSDPWSTECQDSIGIPPFDKGIYSQFCDYCLEIEQRITGDECTCESYDGQVTIPTGTDPHLTDPSKCDCDDCWIVPTKFNKPTDLDCQFTSQCACKDCVPF